MARWKTQVLFRVNRREWRKNMNTRETEIIIREHSRACFLQLLCPLTWHLDSLPILCWVLVSSNSIQFPEISITHYTDFTRVRTKCTETKITSLTLVWGLPIVLCSRSLELCRRLFLLYPVVQTKLHHGCKLSLPVPAPSILSYTEIFPTPKYLTRLDSHFS